MIWHGVSTREYENMQPFWSAIVVTCSDNECAQAFTTELEIRQKKNLIHGDTIILCCVDPRPHVGSGGATINALLQISEHMSALSGYTVVSSDVLKDKRILVIHMGAGSPYTSCSQGFLMLPAAIETISDAGFKYSGIISQLDALLLMSLNLIVKDSPPGFWICSADRVIVVPADIVVDWSKSADVRLFTVQHDVEDAAGRHGVAAVGENNVVDDIIYQGSSDVISQYIDSDGNVPVIVGLVYVNSAVAETLLSMHVVPPLDACTYLGLDAGEIPIRKMSLFFDILLAMAKKTKCIDFVEGIRSGYYGTKTHPDLGALDQSLRKKARSILWDGLHNYHMEAVSLKDAHFHYISPNPADVCDVLLKWPYQYERRPATPTVKSGGAPPVTDAFHVCRDGRSKYVVVNSLIQGCKIGEDAIVLNSHIKGNIAVGDRTMLCNIQSADLQDIPTEISIPPDVVLSSLFIRSASDSTHFGGRHVLIMFGNKDQLMHLGTVPTNTVFNEPWQSFLSRTGILATELWSPEIPHNERCLFNARLYPVYHPTERVTLSLLLWMQGSYKVSLLRIWRSCWRLSLQEIYSILLPEKQFQWQRDLQFQIASETIKDALTNKEDRCLLSTFSTCVMHGYFESLLEVLDEVAMSSDDPAVVSRTFACIADVLGVKAAGCGGLRSGPAANKDWEAAYELIKENKIREGVKAMAKERVKWLSKPALLIRAARHYEGAFQLQVRKAVATARQFIAISANGKPVPMNTWVVGEAPGRLDLAGGWSDTPPITYDFGGLVVSIAITINGQKPIGCRVKRIPEPKVVLMMGLDSPITIECTELAHMSNFNQPNTPGALLKASFFCADLLSLKSGSPSLAEQLLARHASGFVLQTWSILPHGSGLGTSSILAGTILACLWRAAGYDYTVDSVIHAVLDLEQMLTTGGGWQDQVGGLYPGVKVGSSRNALPLRVFSAPVAMPEGFLELLEKHLVVVFTGKTRLARNMLQDVLRNWNERSPEIVSAASQLVENARNCIEAFRLGDLEAIGRCLNECWRHKKKMAHGCEPNVCREIMDQLRPFAYGQCLAGAGGGGFLYVISKQPYALDDIKNELARVQSAKGSAVAHAVAIDRQGLCVKVEDVSS